MAAAMAHDTGYILGLYDIEYQVYGAKVVKYCLHLPAGRIFVEMKWKDFFYFMRQHRSGLLFLMLVSGAACILFALFPTREPRVELGGDHIPIARYDSFMASIRHNDSIRASASSAKIVRRPAALFPFDPNTADSFTLTRLGLPPFVARNVVKYRLAGGRFATPESFARIYGLSQEQFNALRPYIAIGEEYCAKRDTSRPRSAVVRDTVRYPRKYPAGTVIELNAADTAELKKIPGIGSGIARRICAYRSRLGGFSEAGQLQEIPYVPDTLGKWFRVDTALIRRIDVNRASLERLRSHPYLNFYQAKVIIEHRKRKGRLKNLRQLSLYEEFTPADLERLAPYFCFD